MKTSDALAPAGRIASTVSRLLARFNGAQAEIRRRGRRQRGSCIGDDGRVGRIVGIALRIDSELRTHRHADRLANAEEDGGADGGGQRRIGGAEGNGKGDRLRVACPGEIAFLVAFGHGEGEFNAIDVAARRDIDSRRHAGIAGIAPIGLPPPLQLDLQRAMQVAGGIGDTRRHQPHASTLHFDPRTGGCESVAGKRCENGCGNEG